MNLGVHLMLAATATVGATLAPPARRLDESADTQWMLGSYSRVTVPLDTPTRRRPASAWRGRRASAATAIGSRSTPTPTMATSPLAPATTGTTRSTLLTCARTAGAPRLCTCDQGQQGARDVLRRQEGRPRQRRRALPWHARDDGTYSTANSSRTVGGGECRRRPAARSPTTNGGASITESDSKWTIVYSGAKSTGYNVYKLTESAQNKLVLNTVNTDTTTEERAEQPEISADASTVVFQSKFDDTRPDHRGDLGLPRRRLAPPGHGPGP